MKFLNIRKFRSYWNYVADPQRPEDVKIFSKEWFIFILFMLGILGIIGLLALLCLIFDADIDALFNLLIFGGFLFLVGFLFGTERREK